MPDSAIKTSQRLFFYLPTIVVGVCLVVAGIYGDRLTRNAYEKDLRKSVFDQLSVIRARLEGQINSNAQLVQGLVAAINVDPEMSQEHYQLLAKPLFTGHSQLRNIGAAPDYVIRYMYPIAGNEAAIGLDYRKQPKQYDAVKKAEETGELILAGPVNLVQGGQGFIARIPVFLDTSGENGKQFWGIISAVIDVDKLYRTSGLLDENLDIEIAIRGKDASGSKGAVFMGRPELFDAKPELVKIVLPYGSWQLGAVPKQGWSQNTFNLNLFRTGFTGITLFILLLMVMWNRSLLKRRESEAKFNNLFNVAPLPLVFINRNRQLQNFNKRFEQLFGLTRIEPPTFDEWLSLAFPDPDYRWRFVESWNQAVSLARDRQTDIEANEYQVTSIDGQLRSMIISGTLVEQDILATFFDVTEQRNYANALRAERDRAQNYLDTMQVMMVLLDKNGCIAMINRKGCELLGYNENELLGQNWFERCLPLPEGMELVYPMFKQVVRGTIDTVTEFENTVLCRDGGTRLIAWHNAFLQDERGDIIGVLSSGEDITERKEAEKNLIAARDEAQRANKAKSEFLSHMSHELRTPMNAILGFSQLLELETLSPTQLVKVSEIRKAGEHLLELINDVLDLARIEAGRIKLTVEPIRVIKAIDDCVRLFGSVIATNNITIKTDTNRCEQTIVLADSTRLRQSLLNLISNAIKYNRPNGNVTIRCSRLDNHFVRIEVIDTGRGIGKEKLAQLFTAFNRLGADHTDILGTGIGLVITKNLIEMMGGTIGVESEAGLGSRFWISLPAETDTSESLNVDTPSSMPLHLEIANSVYNVLYIEDNPANSMLMTQIFEHRPDVVFSNAGSPNKGLELLQSRPFDLILLDINLPETDGYELLAIIRANDKTKHIPVIAISAMAMEEDIQKGLDAGFSAYFTKPINMNLLFETLDRIFYQQFSI